MRIQIYIMSGAGNIFSVIDNRHYNLNEEFFVSNIAKFCNNPQKNLITDGLIILENSEAEVVNVKFFNPDGSSGMMCGNGGRCSALFAHSQHFIKPEIKDFYLSLANFIYPVKLLGSNNIKIFFPPPRKIEQNIEIPLSKITLTADYVDVNTPHVLINFDYLMQKLQLDNQSTSFHDFDITPTAREIRYHKLFQPTGTNVNFYKINTQDQILLRTYEKGVERETLACGTGTISSALLCHLKHNCQPPITIIPKSNSKLIVDFTHSINNKFEKLSLEGGAEFIGEQSLEL